MINEEVKTSHTFSGMVFSIPEKKDIRKIVILGSGTVRNIEISARVGENEWVSVKNIKEKLAFPIEIHTVVHVDAIRILQKTMTGKSSIDTVQFYTIGKTQ